MKSTIRRALLKGAAAVFMIGALVLPTVDVDANTLPTKEGMSVTFTADKKMESNFTTDDLSDYIGELQPGDNMIFTINLKNEYPQTTDWYMWNKVLKSLEDGSIASGGAYSYKLTYTGAGGTTTLFDSTTVGGDVATTTGEGLHEATDALHEYFFVDSLSSGGTGKVELEVLLDGETQGNSYQDTQADLSMQFAVELPTNKVNVTQQPNTTVVNRHTSTGRTTVVKTNDAGKLIPLYIALTVSGLVLLIAAILLIRKRNKEGEADA